MTDLPILQIAGLRKEYGSFVALKDIDLKVREGEFLTIVGPSGSGKTTLIKLLVGMEEQTEGSIWLRNIRLDRVPANQRPTCMVFQSLALFPHRSVGQNVEFPLKIKGVPAAKRKARALELLAMFRLPESYFDKRIGQCSGGERQRIALARAWPSTRRFSFSTSRSRHWTIVFAKPWKRNSKPCIFARARPSSTSPIPWKRPW